MGADGGLAGRVVFNVERRMSVSHLSVWPRVATDETWMTTLGVWVLLVWKGTFLRMFFRPGQPQSVSVSGSLLRRFSLLGVLATNAPRTVLKSYCLSWDANEPVFACP